MGSPSIFEVRVEIKGDTPIMWHSWKGGAEYAKKWIMLHIERRTPKQAVDEAKKFGKVIYCRQMKASEIIENEARRIESIPLNNETYVNLNPYPNAIAMDELLWTKKKDTRRQNFQKDKKFNEKDVDSK